VGGAKRCLSEDKRLADFGSGLARLPGLTKQHPRHSASLKLRRTSLVLLFLMRLVSLQA